MGVGLRDNLLLSHAGEEQRGFLRGVVDATAWHVPQNRIDYLAVLSATGTRYFASSSVDHEEQVITLGTWRYRSGEAFRFSIDGNASYSHLIYDVSDTDVQQVVTEVKRSAAGIGPTLRWGFLPAWWVETQAAARRETYPDGFNNRGIQESAIRIGWHPGKRLEREPVDATRSRPPGKGWRALESSGREPPGEKVPVQWTWLERTPHRCAR